jgi:hypothetical protein
MRVSVEGLQRGQKHNLRHPESSNPLSLESDGNFEPEVRDKFGPTRNSVSGIHSRRVRDFVIQKLHAVTERIGSSLFTFDLKESASIRD